MEVLAPAMDTYISDGLPTPAIAINILDQAGTLVTTGDCQSPHSPCAVACIAYTCQDWSRKLQCTHGTLPCKTCLLRLGLPAEAEAIC